MWRAKSQTPLLCAQPTFVFRSHPTHRSNQNRRSKPRVCHAPPPAPRLCRRISSNAPRKQKEREQKSHEIQHEGEKKGGKISTFPLLLFLSSVTAISPLLRPFLPLRVATRAASAPAGLVPPRLEQQKGARPRLERKGAITATGGKRSRRGAAFVPLAVPPPSRSPAAVLSPAPPRTLCAATAPLLPYAHARKATNEGRGGATLWRGAWPSLPSFVRPFFPIRRRCPRAPLAVATRFPPHAQPPAFEENARRAARPPCPAPAAGGDAGEGRRPGLNAAVWAMVVIQGGGATMTQRRPTPFCFSRAALPRLPLRLRGGRPGRRSRAERARAPVRGGESECGAERDVCEPALSLRSNKDLLSLVLPVWLIARSLSPLSVCVSLVLPLCLLVSKRAPALLWLQAAGGSPLTRVVAFCSPARPPARITSPRLLHLGARVAASVVPLLARLARRCRRCDPPARLPWPWTQNKTKTNGACNPPGPAPHDRPIGPCLHTRM